MTITPEGFALGFLFGIIATLTANHWLLPSAVTWSARWLRGSRWARRVR